MKMNMVLRNSVVDAIVGSIGNTASFYTGTMPTSGDTAPTGTLITQCSADSGSLLTWGTSVAGVSTLDISGYIAGTDAVTVANTIGYLMLGSGTFRVYCTAGTIGTEFILSSLGLFPHESLSRFSGTITY